MRKKVIIEVIIGILIAVGILWGLSLVLKPKELPTVPCTISTSGPISSEYNGTHTIISLNLLVGDCYKGKAAKVVATCGSVKYEGTVVLKSPTMTLRVPIKGLHLHKVATIKLYINGKEVLRKKVFVQQLQYKTRFCSCSWEQTY